MKRQDLERLDVALCEFLDGLSDCVSRKDQRQSFVKYVTGLLLDGERKSVQPMAMRLVERVRGDASAATYGVQVVHPDGRPPTVIYAPRESPTFTPELVGLHGDDVYFTTTGTVAAYSSSTTMSGRTSSSYLRTSSQRKQ